MLMNDIRFALDRITVATLNMKAMVKFYEKVFDASLQAKSAYGTTLYEGSLANLNLLLCPNEVAKVQAEQNRHQLRFIVTDVEETLRRAWDAGGSLEGDIVEDAGEKVAAVRDPDGNTIEFRQPA